MENLGRLIVIIGIVTVVVGAVVWLGARSGILTKIPFGRLPGDIRIENPNITCIFPLATMIIVSIVLTVLLNIIVRFLK